MPKVSVIVPVYKAESTIERCATQLFEQTLDDIEYIFIDDCSPDDSIQKLEKVLSRYPSRHDKVRIVHMDVNSGVAKVRSIGVSMATGEYVIHCDSDDWPEIDMYEGMYLSTEGGRVDMVVSGFVFEINQIHQEWSQDFSNKDPIIALLNNQMSSGLWNKMVRRELYLAPFVMPSYDMCEDFLYTTQFLLKSNLIAYYRKNSYHYYYNPNSVTHDWTKSGTLIRHSQIVENVKASIELIRSRRGYGPYESAIVRQCFLVKNGLRDYTKDLDIYRIWKETFKEVNSKIILCKDILFKEKVIYILIYFHLYSRYKRASAYLQSKFKIKKK